ncbi:MAG: type II toxin-antitoxin system Phd/YefM family antitoxin [Desulfobacterales bacterium]|nr:type II toxin-antitoxin system Phd/YefM family antitoxin [Desulfobacterales bacterium]
MFTTPYPRPHCSMLAIMQKQFSISETKNRLPTIIHYVEKVPYVELIRRGKPVAVINLQLCLFQ